MIWRKQPLAVEIKRNYGLDVYGMAAQRGGWLLETNRGKFQLKALDSSEAEILFHYSIYQYLKGKGFQQLLDVFATRDGKPYMVTEEGRFQMVAWEEYESIAYDDGTDLQKVVKIMADFHKSSEGFQAIAGSKVRTEWGRWPWVFQAYCTLGNKMKQLFREKHHREKTEKGILESIDNHLEMGHQCIMMLKETPYLDIVEESMKKRELCIHRLSEKNFIKNQQTEIKIFSLEDTKHDIKIIDVADLILENLERSEKIPSILGEYHSHNPLSGDEIKIIQAYIRFPHEYFKMIEKYYKNKSGGSDSYWNKKLKKALKVEKMKKNLMDLDLCGMVKNDA